MNDAATRLVLVTGLSGAGRLSILRALEDLGYEAIDNLPTNAIESVVKGDPARRIAIGADVRSRGFDPDALVDVLNRLRADPALRAELLFVLADDASLLRRYTETRRRHPMAAGGRVADGIAAERTLTAPLHVAADHVLDTSDLAIPALRLWIERHFAGEADAAPQVGLAVAVMSFAYPAGLPREADLVLDARFLRNPHYVPALRPLTGQDKTVADFVAADPDFVEFYGRVEGLIDLVLPRFVQEGKKYATIAIGCTGGRHRSVAIVERLGDHLAAQGWRVSVTHRELARAEEQAHMAARQVARTMGEDLAGEPLAPALPQPAPVSPLPALRSDTTP